MIRRPLNRAAAAGALAAALLSPAALAADPGVAADKIVLGQSAAMDGPTKALGLAMNLGLRAAFEEINKAGGVGGRKIELVNMDDGYEPERAVANTKALIDEKQVFALVGYVGTPTANAATPISTEKKVPFIGAFTGAGSLRDPFNRYIVNVRASYGQEAEAWVEHLTKDLGITKIAILYQNDSFGQAGLAGTKKALEKRGMALAAEGTYERNTTAVKSALLTIQKAQPEAVVMVGAYAPLAEFIRLAKKIKLDAVFVNISFVGSNALAADLGADGAGVVVTQVVPLPTDASVPLVAAYQKALAAVDAEAKPGFGTLEGYAVGKFVAEALGKVQGEPTREGLLDAIQATGAFDLGGFKLQYGANDNQGSDSVFFTIIQADSSFKQVDKLAK